jgi:hypothetical protein
MGSGHNEMRHPEEICPDLHERPERWKLDENDVPYGKALLEAIRPFIEHLISAGLREKTIEDHIDNLWLLGGEIIRKVNFSNDYSTPALRKLKESVRPDGGPYCQHLKTEAELRSFDNTCRKLHKFFRGSLR